MAELKEEVLVVDKTKRQVGNHLPAIKRPQKVDFPAYDQAETNMNTVVKTWEAIEKPKHISLIW